MENTLMRESGLRSFLVTMILLGTMTSCCGVFICEPPPVGPCDIETLLVNEALLPKGWKEQGPPRSVEATVRFGVEKLGTSFSTPTRGVAIQDVYRATDARAAVVGYKDFMSFFSLREEETEWVLPVGLVYRSPVADQSRLGCSTNRSSGVERCQFIGQYDVYLVKFHTYMSSDMMTYQDLERILRDIDRRMAECLGR
jgi:hypothetical protein